MSAFWLNLFGMLLGVLLGGLITLLAARKYYERASQELKEEATKLRGLVIRARG